MLKRLTNVIACALFGAFLIFYGWAVQTASSQQVSGENKGKYPPSYESHQNQDKESWPQRATEPIAIFTLLLVFVGGTQLGFFYVQLRLIRRSLDDAKVTANAAKDGATAARESADIAKESMVAGSRAYVHYAGCRWVSHRENDQSPVFWRIRPMWINSGGTPTRNLAVYAHYVLQDDGLSDNYQFVPDHHDSIPATLPPKERLESQWRDIWGHELVAVKNGSKHLYIWGTATYRDVFFPRTEQHITKFCVEATNITGDPLLPWHEDSNPMHIAFETYRRHNCADNDCTDDD